ncbi:MAG: FkbM family methyltransferase [Chthoniobacterales bacterium]
MSSLTAWLKPVVLAQPWLAENFYGAMTRWRAWEAARRGAPFGQSGEDIWLRGWLRENGIPWADDGFYIDIGANHPVVLSATYLLYREGWRGLTVDPIPSLCALHRHMRPRDTCLNVGIGARPGIQPFWETAPDYFCSFSHDAAREAEASGWCRVLRETRVDVATPQDILARVPGGTRVNYLSIDTEGLDAEILGHWPWDTCRPDLVSCEASADHESEASQLLAAAGYRPLKDFPVTAFWWSPELAGTGK